MADFKERILGGDGIPRYNLVRENGTLVETNIRLVLSSSILQEGDSFGAREVNKLLKINNDSTIDVDIYMEGY